MAGAVFSGERKIAKAGELLAASSWITASPISDSM
jgi:hypothetical protein